MKVPWAWRDRGGIKLTQLPLASNTPGEYDGALHIGRKKMADLILDELKEYPNVEVRFGIRWLGIKDLPSSKKVKIMAH